jgi:ADP-heptose:LPS heptosyltransferase
VNLYMEFVGGLGDAIIRMYFSGRTWYGAIESLLENERARVVLMSHSPYLAEIFKWHPKRKQIDVNDLGFKTPFHPWENAKWRMEHGLAKEAVCPPHSPAETLKFYPSPSDQEILDELRGQKFVVLSATASSPQKTIPVQIRQEMATVAISMGFKVLVVGRRYYFKDGRVNDIEVVPGVIDAVDNLTVPGTIEAIKLSRGVLTAHSAALHMAWCEKRPVFLLYDTMTGKLVLPAGAVGYMHGAKQLGTDHMYISDYKRDRFAKWMAARG